MTENATPCRVALVNFYAEGHHAPYLRDLAGGLEDVGVQVAVLGPPALQEFAKADQIVPLKGCERLGDFKGARRQWAAVSLCREAIAKAIAWQSTHIHFLYADWHVSAIAAAWRLSRPTARLVMTVHWSAGVGGGALGIKDRLRRSPHRAALRWLAGQEGARVLVHHEAVARDLSSIVSSKKIGVIPYPTQPLPSVEMECQMRIRQTLGVEPQGKLILCYGNTRFDKGADLAVCALAKLPVGFHLLLAGQAQHFQPDELRREARALGVEDRIHFIPRFLSDEESTLVFHACDIVLLPYRRGFSGQSGPLTQAAAIGKPIVVADLPVLAATVRAFDLGMVFPPESIEGMAEALQVASQWEPLPQDTKEFVAKHSPMSFSRIVYENYLEFGIEGKAP